MPAGVVVLERRRAHRAAVKDHELGHGPDPPSCTASRSVTPKEHTYSRHPGTQAARPARTASSIHDRSRNVFPLPAGADTSVTRAAPPSRPNSAWRDTTPRTAGATGASAVPDRTAGSTAPPWTGPVAYCNGSHPSPAEMIFRRDGHPVRVCPPTLALAGDQVHAAPPLSTACTLRPLTGGGPPHGMPLVRP